MISRNMRTIAAIGFLECAMAFMPVGCGSRLGPITASLSRPDGRAPVPSATVERLKACMAEFGEQLGPGSHAIHPVIKADKNGVKWSVTENDIPNTAPEFGACARQALRDMEIPGEFFRLTEVMQQRVKGDVSKAQRQNMGSPAILVAVVAIGLSELVLEAGAFTILFAISVELENDAIKGAEEALNFRRLCNDRRTDCLETSIASGFGPNWGSSRCEGCYNACMQDRGLWPSLIDLGGRMVPCE